MLELLEREVLVRPKKCLVKMVVEVEEKGRRDIPARLLLLTYNPPRPPLASSWDKE